MRAVAAHGRFCDFQFELQSSLFLGGFRLLHLLDGESEQADGHDEQEGCDEDQRPVLVDVLHASDQRLGTGHSHHAEHQQELVAGSHRRLPAHHGLRTATPLCQKDERD